jgi:hypothetical protein
VGTLHTIFRTNAVKGGRGNTGGGSGNSGTGIGGSGSLAPNSDDTGGALYKQNSRDQSDSADGQRIFYGCDTAFGFVFCAHEPTIVGNFPGYKTKVVPPSG